MNVSLPARLEPADFPSAGPVPPAQDVVAAARADMLACAIAVLEDSGIAWCTLGEPAGLMDPGAGDVDLLVDAPARRLRRLLAEAEALGAEIALARGGYLVLARVLPCGRVATLALDAVRDIRVDGCVVIEGRAVLARRRPVPGGHAPAPADAFAATLARTIAKRGFTAARGRRLAEAFAADPDGARRAAAALLGEDVGARICAAVEADAFATLAADAAAWRATMVGRARRARPVGSVLGALAAIGARAGRLARPDGLTVAMLGPDGAGKSSVIERLEGDDMQIFSRIECRGFAPRIFDTLRPRIGRVEEPHALAPRSPLASCARALWWLVYYLSAGIETRFARAQGRLILYDRHFVDILVDRRRYRYGGPGFVLRLVWLIVPKPDLVVLLDAPAEVLQSRKQEVPFEVTKRQRDAYRALVESLPQGRIVDASEAFDAVVEGVRRVVLEELVARERKGA